MLQLPLWTLSVGAIRAPSLFVSANSLVIWQELGAITLAWSMRYHVFKHHVIADVPYDDT